MRVKNSLASANFACLTKPDVWDAASALEVSGRLLRVTLYEAPDDDSSHVLVNRLW